MFAMNIPIWKSMLGLACCQGARARDEALGISMAMGASLPILILGGIVMPMLASGGPSGGPGTGSMPPHGLGKGAVVGPCNPMAAAVNGFACAAGAVPAPPCGGGGSSGALPIFLASQTLPFSVSGLPQRW